MVVEINLFSSMLNHSSSYSFRKYLIFLKNIIKILILVLIKNTESKLVMKIFSFLPFSHTSNLLFNNNNYNNNDENNNNEIVVKI